MKSSTSVARWLAQIVGDGVDPFGISRQPKLDLLQERHPICGTLARAGPREGGPRRRTARAEDVALAAPAVVDVMPRTGRWRRSRPDGFPPRVALGVEGT